MRGCSAVFVAALDGSLAQKAESSTSARAFVPPSLVGSSATPAAPSFSPTTTAGASAGLLDSGSRSRSSSSTAPSALGLTASEGGGGSSCTEHPLQSVASSPAARRIIRDVCLAMTSEGIDKCLSSPFPCGQCSQPQGKAYSAAACLRGGGGIAGDEGGGGGDGDGDGDGVADRPFSAVVAAAAVEGLTAGVKRNHIFLDRVEDTLGDVWNTVRVVLRPFGHVMRLGFGLSLLFYGMAFRTFAFHVIVFRVAGFKQVQRSFWQLVEKYREARKAIREAASAAETAQKYQEKKAAQADKLKAARERMIAEKHLLLANGRKLTIEDTRKFMKKYNKELTIIKEEQAKFNAINSSIVSVKTSVDPNEARSGIWGLYNALITSFTASTYQPAGQVALGLHVGTLLKRHLLDLFGPILDPIGYRLDLTTYYDEAEIPYMGSANAMDGPRNLMMNIFCYALVFTVIRVHPPLALKAAMIYFGARVVTDYILMTTEPVRRKLGLMTAVHTPWSAIVHAGLAILGFYCHRDALHTAGLTGFHPLVMGPGPVGLVEPCVRFAVWVSEVLHKIEFFTVNFVSSGGK
eukprot:g13500.t2